MGGEALGAWRRPRPRDRASVGPALAQRPPQTQPWTFHPQPSPPSVAAWCQDLTQNTVPALGAACSGGHAPELLSPGQGARPRPRGGRGSRWALLGVRTGSRAPDGLLGEPAASAQPR